MNTDYELRNLRRIRLGEHKRIHSEELMPDGIKTQTKAHKRLRELNAGSITRRSKNSLSKLGPQLQDTSEMCKKCLKKRNVQVRGKSGSFTQKRKQIIESPEFV